jgi:hypothetical protein
MAGQSICHCGPTAGCVQQLMAFSAKRDQVDLGIFTKGATPD